MIRVTEPIGTHFYGFSVDLFDDEGRDVAKPLHVGLEATDAELGPWIATQAKRLGASRAEVFEINRHVKLIGRWQLGSAGWRWTSCR